MQIMYSPTISLLYNLSYLELKDAFQYVTVYLRSSVVQYWHKDLEGKCLSYTLSILENKHLICV